MKDEMLTDPRHWTPVRTYERTHPWLTFDLTLRRASPKLWTLLGRAHSECEQIARVPLPPASALELDRRCVAKGVAANAAIGGSAITEQDVLKQLKGELGFQPPRERLAQETANLIEACEEIGKRLSSGKSADLTVERIKSLNRTVLANTSVGPKVVPGEIRRHEVSGLGYKPAPAEDCEFLLGRLCQWLNGECFAPPPDLELVCGLLKAIAAHVYIAWIHPFGDGNGRTARLLEFQILLEVHIPAPAAHLLSSHYNQTRHEYYHQLQQASESGAGILPFIEYAVQGLIDGLKNLSKLVREQQTAITWREHICQIFRDKTAGPDVRRQHLALDLFLRRDWVPVSEIRQISARVAEAYAGKTPKCISRDLSILEQMGLVERARAAVRARPDIVSAFQPAGRRAGDANEAD